MGIDIRFLEADEQGNPGAEIQGGVLRGEQFWVDVRVEDIRDTTSQGVIALPLNLSWDPSIFQLDRDAPLPAQGLNPLPAGDPLVTDQFPIQRAVDSFDSDAPAFDGTADPGMLLDFFNLRGVRGAALPNAGQGQPIGAGASETFSQLRFVAIANSDAAPVTVNLDGSMSFADADPLDAVDGIANTTNVTALANTVQASIPIVGGSISGEKFDDADGDGVRDDGEQGVQGVTIVLLPIDPQGDQQEVVTGADGSYSFDDLAAGMYEVSEMLPVNSVRTFPTDNYMVTLDQDNQTTTGLDFGNFTLVTIGGTKYDDLNGNGVRDDGEPGLPGVTIELDLDSDGSVDRTAVTEADGSYQFDNVPPGMHTITEVLPPGFERTSPGPIVVAPISGQDDLDRDIGNFGLTDLGGLVFDDRNRDGEFNGDDEILPGATVELDLDNDGSIDETTTTGADGRYLFENVGAGTHLIRETPPSGFVPTEPDPPEIVVPNMSGQSRTDLDFGNRRVDVDAGSSISGLVYTDNDRDGQIDPGEVGIPGVTVELFVDGSNTPAQTTTTGAGGGYAFNNLEAGDFRIVQTQPNQFNAVSITVGTVLPSGDMRGTTVGLNTFENLTLDGQETAIDFNFGQVLVAVTKRMFLASTNARAEIARSAGMPPAAILGTEGNDQISIVHLADSRMEVTVNGGTPRTFGADRAQFITVDGLGGDDNVTYVGNDQDESIQASPSELAVTTAAQMLGVFNAEQIRVQGGGGDDQAILRDSSGADQLTASGNSAILSSSDNRRIELVDVDTLQAISSVDSGDDQADVQAIDFVLQLAGDWRS